jgi:putative spermidine/putrescine transport system substrate-binding protein
MQSAYDGCLALTLALALGGMAATRANAQQVLYFAGYGGTSEQAFREKVLPRFEVAHNVRIEYIAGASTNNLARLQAQRDKPEVDVAVLDDGPMQQAVSLGLCAPVAPAPVLNDLYDVARANGDGKAVGVGIVATGLAYNIQVYEKEGWPAPTSWLDLAAPQVKGKVLVPSITNTYGLETLLAINRIKGGSYDNIEPGLDFIAKEVAPSVRTFEASSSKISELFQTGEVVLGVWGSGRVSSLAATGFPVRMVYPKEGAGALVTTACPVAGSDVPELQQALVQFLVSPEVQMILAEHNGWGPTNRQVKLSDEIAKGVIYGSEKVGALKPTDWSVVNKHRSEWTKRWTREVEQ